MSDRDELKRMAAVAALEFVQPGSVIGVGTGSTAAHFIEALAGAGTSLAGAVASSEDTRSRLWLHGIPVVTLNEVGGRLGLYIDGADEVDPWLRMIKGGGGALTREKIIATAAETFVCIADDSKLANRLGALPLPVEVMPIARALVSREIGSLGGTAVARAGIVTDNGNEILDVTGLDLADPVSLEAALETIPGVLTCGLFARRRADVLLLGTQDGIKRLERPANAGETPAQ